MDKVICIENTANHYWNDWTVGQIYDCEIEEPGKFRISRNNSAIWLDEDEGLEFRFSQGGIIKFKKYNFRKEKLERILNG
jgi:hypothetical protein